MGVMDGKVAVVTGGGRGIGREECLLLAAEGARVVVNDVDAEPAAEVVALVEATGGEAVASTDDITGFDGAKRLIDLALSRFGRLDALINNAGIVRDGMVFNLTEEDFDAVVAVHLKGHFNTTRWAALHWRAETKKGNEAPRHIVNTTSGAGLLGNPGQTSYGAAKAGIAAMTQIWSRELDRYGVRVNAIAPIARTRLTVATFGDAVDTSGEAFDVMHPGNIAPLAVYLASDLSNDVTGEVLGIKGGEIERWSPWQNARSIESDGRWTPEAIARRIREVL